MNHIPIARRALAEAFGTGLLVIVVVGSGIMAQQLSPHDVGLQLGDHIAPAAMMPSSAHS